jgi:hypothetical protein
VSTDFDLEGILGVILFSSMRWSAWISILVTVLLGCFASAQTARPHYVRTTVEQIIKAGKRMDGKHVEVVGSISAGFETDAFRDASRCDGMKVSACTAWLKYDGCAVVRDPDPKKLCNTELARAYREHGIATGSHSLIMSNVIVRGIASTIRHDVTYDKSVPDSARRGNFGHLGGYPAQITEELQFPNRE